MFSDYNDLVLGEDIEGQTRAVIEFLVKTSKQWDIIDFRDFRDTGDAVAHTEHFLQHAQLPFRRLVEEERCPYFQIDGPWSKTMKEKHLRFARRAFTQFTQKSSEGFRTRIVDNPHQEPKLLAKMIAVEAQKQVGGKPSPPFLGVYPEVFQSLFDVLGPQGWITIVLVEANERLVAFRFLFRCARKLWDFLTAYDHTFSTMSPGTVLICAAIDYGFEHEFDEFDFMRGEETYKQRWTSVVHQNQRMLIWNRRWLSRFSAWAYIRFRVRRPMAAS